MRSRVEAREVTGTMAALELELERLRGLHSSTEEQLRGRRWVASTTLLLLITLLAVVIADVGVYLLVTVVAGTH